MTNSFISSPSYIDKLEAFTYNLTGIHMPISDITLTGVGIAFVLLALKAPMFDVGHR